MPAGRPPKFKTPEDMQKVIDDYFATEEIPTVCGMALHLGFATRAAFLYYENEKPEFLSTIKAAKMRIERFLEHLLLTKNGQIAGVIFSLKNNFGWKDTQQLDHNVTLPREIHIIGVDADDTAQD